MTVDEVASVPLTALMAVSDSHVSPLKNWKVSVPLHVPENEITAVLSPFVGIATNPFSALIVAVLVRSGVARPTWTCAMPASV